MTADAFRRLALSMPDAVEGAHMGHPDFRVKNKIFATLGPAEAWGMVSLTPEQQAEFTHDHPATFSPVKGAWGRGGATKVTLKSATATALRPAMNAAYRNTVAKAAKKR